ncbi:MAG: nicotinate-nucleotide adenylyltransferase [Burkholderiales bacterium]|nr:nicotinate-nucleotide adenylyltransferase [Burkholderiales bacterium]
MAEAGAPIGILGGTFDPIHYGHLRLAEEAADQCRLERVLLVPAALPNLRAAPGTPAQHRAAMARLAAAGNARLEVDDRELRREGTSYTVDTLAELRCELGAARALCLILGADAFMRLPAWSRWLELFDLCHVVVAARPGYDLTLEAAREPDIARQWQRRKLGEIQQLQRAPAGAIARIDIPLLEISATDLRARMSRGASVEYLLPHAVVDYIAAHRLYRL